MGRPRRQILSGKVYEICFRTREGLPFVATQYMQLIIQSIIARVQRDHKVTLCHFLWMANHPHMIIRAKDAEQCTRFVGEVEKQLTEAIKRLLRLEHLNLWTHNKASVIPYGDAEGVMTRIAYLYANPASADLVDTIERYPGCSSWEAFKGISHSLKACHQEEIPWIRAPSIPKLPSLSVSKAQDEKLVQRLRAGKKRSHSLTLYPNAWMESFGMTEEEVEETNAGIRAELKEREETARLVRNQSGRKVMGAEKLSAQPLTLRYRPKGESRRIFAYAACGIIRTEMIKAYKDFCNACDECYQRWKSGDYTVEWPPGAFLPAAPPRYNWWLANG